MAVVYPFSPTYDSGFIVTAGAVTASSPIPMGTPSVCITNQSAVFCYVHVGDVGVTASTKDYPIPPNQQVVITRDINHSRIAYIAVGGTGNLHIMVGTGA